jgi:pimeloyl-ACP methyl ester carboxylesterase
METPSRRGFLVIARAAGPRKGTILFVHGSSVSSTPVFDLEIPGRPESSTLQWFARKGFDTWCFDCEGYGRSDKSRPVNADVACGADDLEAVSEYILRTTGAGQLMLYGSSSGALRAALFAQRHPERVQRLALEPQAPGELPRQPPPAHRPRDDPQHLHARPSGHQRPHGGGSLRRRGAQA